MYACNSGSVDMKINDWKSSELISNISYFSYIRKYIKQLWPIFLQHNAICFIRKLTWNQASHISGRPLWLSCHSTTLRIVLLLPCFHPDFENIFDWNFFFFFEILKKNLRYRFYSGACCQSTQSWWLFWCCVWPHLPRYKRPHVNLSLRIICHSTSLYLRQTDGHSPLPHSTQHSYSEKTGKAAADGNAHRIFRYTGSHGGKCRYFNSIWKAR